MYQVITLAVPVFGLIFLGFAAAKLFKHDENGLDWLNTFVIYFALPALFFNLLSQTPFEQLTNFAFIFATTLTTAIIFTAIICASVFAFKVSLAESTIRGAVAGYGNVGYMGMALALTALGPSAAVPATLIICFDSLLFFIAVPLLIAMDKSMGGAEQKNLKKQAKEIGMKVALHPFIVSSFLGMLAAFINLQIPLPLARLLDYLSAAAAPCALFALGVTIAAKQLKRLPDEMPWLIFAKLVIHPILAYFIVKLLADPSEIWLLTAILLASLPTAANVFVLASQYQVYVERTSSTILISTIFSIITVTALLFLVQNNSIP